MNDDILTKDDNMEKVALRNKSGDWIYYLTSFSYNDVKKYVVQPNELHNSDSLNDLIQRELTDNAHNICDYIGRDSEHFFNALVLAVYDGNPTWREIEVIDGKNEFFNVGLLSFSGMEKIFPVDGQHRVMGIKEFVKKNKDNELAYRDESIPVILISHINNEEGKRRSRKLFTVLNRYAKPVKLSEVIALDESDITAITTRYLVDNLEIFRGNRTSYSKTESMKDKKAFTNLITLYRCNEYLVKKYLSIPNNEVKVGDQTITSKNFKNKTFLRWPDEKIDDFNKFAEKYWINFMNISSINEYLKDESDEPAIKYRNNENGGNILFRPVSLKPLVEVTMEKIDDIDQIIQTINSIDLSVSNKIWNNVLWDATANKMIARNNKEYITTIFKMILDVPVQDKEKDKFLNQYKVIFNSENALLNDVLRLYEEMISELKQA